MGISYNLGHLLIKNMSIKLTNYKLKATCSVQYMGNEIAHVTQWMKTVTSDKHGIMEENI